MSQRHPYWLLLPAVLLFAPPAILGLRSSPGTRTLPQPSAGPALSAEVHGRLTARLMQLEELFEEADETAQAWRLEETRAFAAEVLEEVRSLGPEAAPLVPPLERAVRNMVADASPFETTHALAELRERLAGAGALPIPARSPSAERGAELYRASCEACHGSRGHGDGPAAAQLRPAPESFHDEEFMDGLSPQVAFLFLTHGVHGTAMPAFETMEPADRWALAFHLFGFRQPGCVEPDAARPSEPLEVLATASDGQLVDRHGREGLACLRRHRLHMAASTLDL